MDTTQLKHIRLTECHRDAMQGLKDFVPTQTKASYIQTLLNVGFDVLDFGSFVSPKAIPQMQDTEEVLASLNLENTKTKLLAIVANERGALQAASHASIDFIGFPFSVSPEFQLRNTNSTLNQAADLVGRIAEICDRANKKPNIYLSMAFGNPYGEHWAPDIVAEWIDVLNRRYAIRQFALSDTVGSSKRDTIIALFEMLNRSFSDLEFGAHFHSAPSNWREKAEAALDAGCLNFDGALRGFGGCPMAADSLTGNMPTEQLFSLLLELGYTTNIQKERLETAVLKASQFFGIYH